MEQQVLAQLLQGRQGTLDSKAQPVVGQWLGAKRELGD